MVFVIKRILILLSIISFGAYFAYNYLAPKGSELPKNYKYEDLYPITFDKATNFSSPVKFSLDTTYIEWAMYGYQGLIALYMLLTFCRSEALGILPNWFYLFWSFACLAEMAYTTIIFRNHFLGAFLMMSLAALFRHVSLGFAFYGLRRYLNYSMEPIKFDVWCNRLLVQNGLLFRQAWITVMVVIRLASILNEKFSVPSIPASYASLTVVAVLLIVWFLIQNFLIEAWTRFTLAEYLCLAFPLTGILLQTKKDLGVGHIYFKFSIGLLALDGFLLLVRFCLIIVNERRRAKPSLETTEKIEM